MRNEILTHDELLNLERQGNSDTIASMNFLGLPVICLSINLTIDALNELAVQFFRSSVNELVGANFRELCAKYQLDFPIFSQKNDILAGEVVQDFSQWILNAEKDAVELKWSIIRHLDKNYQPSGFILVMTSGFQDMAHNLQASQQVSSEDNFQVLLIEDNQVCQSIAKSLFEDLFCDVTIANTAKQALEYLHSNYDIIFLDIGLPGKDGMALAGELRRRLQLKIPIVATTGYAWDVNRYREVGINDYIRKPLTKTKLQKALMKFL
ncbi:MAG: response regulator [Gammaproteobacteria bacterium]|jgi:CheY-like chemotaxis protein